MKFVPGLGAIPSQWETRTGRRVISVRNDPPRGTDGVVTAFRDGRVTLRANRRVEGFTESIKEIGYQHVEPGNLVVHSMDGFAGAIGVSDSRGKMSPVVHVCDVDGDPRYLAYVLRHLAASGLIQSLAKGIRERSTSFDRATLMSLVLPHPPHEQQRRIADFLDDLVARIDNVISLRERQLGLAREWLAATRAAEFSGGQRVPFKAAVWFREGPGILAADFRDEGVPLLRISNIRSGVFTAGYSHFLDETAVAARWEHFRVEPGEILTSGSASAGLAIVAPEEACGAVPYTGLIRMRPRLENIPVEYVRHFVLSSDFLEQMDMLKTGVAIQHWGPYHLSQARISLVDDAIAAAARLDDAEAQVRTASTVMTTQIEMLTEYKHSLITAAVTGELDVTTASSEVPA